MLFLPGQLSAAVVILNGLTHTHTLQGTGAITQGIIRVKNEGAKDARILVYRQDLVSDCAQGTQYPERGGHQRSLGEGLKTNVDERTVAPNEVYEVRYTIELDNAKSDPGTYWEVVMVEVAEPVREEARKGVIVNSTVRYAVQVIVDVGTFEGPQLSYENVAFEKMGEGQSNLKVLLKNNGTFASRTNLVLEVYDATGKLLKTTKPNTRMLYPGQCNTFEVPVSDLEKGKYDCVIVADTGKDLFGSNITLQVD